MNPFFPMNQNNNDDEERQPTVFEIDEETDVHFLEQAYAYHQQLVAEENRPRLTRNPINRDREGAEERLMADYFNDHCRDNTKGEIKKYPTIMVVAGENNDINVLDINVLDNSQLFDDLLDDKAPVAPYVATFVKSFTVANDAKHAYFKKRQEGAQKDVERAFGVLQGRWGIIQQPARQYHVNTIRRIMYSCIIMHNMILKDQKMAVFDWNDVYANPSRNMQRTWIERCETQRRKNKEIRDREMHLSLQRNLMEHIWQEVEHEDEDF
ncbi:ALP1-like protein isoform X1 [Tanacetum coccineum]